MYVQAGSDLNFTCTFPIMIHKITPSVLLLILLIFQAIIQGDREVYVQAGSDLNLTCTFPMMIHKISPSVLLLIILIFQAIIQGDREVYVQAGSDLNLTYTYLTTPEPPLAVIWRHVRFFFIFYLIKNDVIKYK